jgi:ParB-like chromosome segregation protein Spo0J
MEKPVEYKFHEAANIFPLDDEHLQSLADDIKKNGQHFAIEILDGKILDGRRRSIACRLAGVEPVVRVVSVDDPVAYVLSLNLHRRHLTPSQASMCAARARDIYERDAKKRLDTKGGHSGPVNLPEAKGDARDLAGKAFGVSGKSVDHAKRVLDNGIPELAKAVDSGRIAVSTAAVIAADPPEEQKAAIEKQANRDYSKVAGRTKAEEKEQPKPRHAGEHNQSETFAITKADVAITQLKGIPASNVHRDAALDRVVSWIKSQRKAK